MDLTAALCESISRLCDVPAADIRPDSTLTDLGFDSLASAEVLTDLEITLGYEFSAQALRDLNRARTFGDVVEILNRAARGEARATAP